MKKDLGVCTAVFPLPVLMIATYCEDGSVDVMNMAWGGVCDSNMVALNLEESHKTVENLRNRKAFTLSIADEKHIKESDFFGIASANNVKDKFMHTSFHAIKSTRVDAPIIQEYPITLECRVREMQNQITGLRVLGEIVNVMVDESILGEDGKVDITKLNAISFDPFKNAYYKIGEKVADAFKVGKELLD